MTHRKVNSLLTLISVFTAIACLVGAQVVLRGGELETQAILAAKQKEVASTIAEHTQQVEQAGKALNDAARKEMLKLGFNVLIVPENQDLSDLHLNGTLSETMPETHVDKLASSKIITINHLLPCVTKRIQWSEQDNLDIILYGTRGEVPILHRGLKKPLLDAVPPDTMVVGYEIHEKLNLQVGQKVELLGQEFTVKTLHPPRGSVDDVTVWIDLAQAQQLLGMQNVIHAIMALECDCAGDRITQIRSEIEAILPGTHVVERFSQAITRAEMRAKAKSHAQQALRQAKEDGEQRLQNERDLRASLEWKTQSQAGTFVVFALLASAVIVAALAVVNVRQRRNEIGVLRALGLNTRQIMTLFLSKSLLIGFIGGILGCLVGLVVGVKLAGDGQITDLSLASFMESSTVIATLVLGSILAPTLAVIASWLPSLSAARHDPALILHET